MSSRTHGVLVAAMSFMAARCGLTFGHLYHEISRMHFASGLELQPAAISAGLGESGVNVQFASFCRGVGVDELFGGHFHEHEVGFFAQIVLESSGVNGLAALFDGHRDMLLAARGEAAAAVSGRVATRRRCPRTGRGTR